MENPNLIDLSACRGDLALLDEDSTRYIKVMLPVGTSPAAFELERQGIELYNIPTLFRLWANVVEQQLVQGGGEMEEGDNAGP